MFSIQANTIAETWEASIEKLLLTEDYYHFDSERGFCIETEAVTLHVLHPDWQPQLSPKYIFPNLVDEYKSKIAGKVPELRTTYERIHCWVQSDQTLFDQYQFVTNLLIENTYSRAGVISIWNPEIDLHIGRSISPVMLYFSVRENALNVSIIARSSDAWVSSQPEMIGFSEIQADMANELKIKIGRLTFHAMSYHLYEYDLLPARKSFLK